MGAKQWLWAHMQAARYNVQRLTTLMHALYEVSAYATRAGSVTIVY